jgi:hypothetical protein
MSAIGWLILVVIVVVVVLVGFLIIGASGFSVGSYVP